MASQNPDTTGVKVESSTNEPGNSDQPHHGGSGTGQQNRFNNRGGRGGRGKFDGGRGGGGRFQNNQRGERGAKNENFAQIKREGGGRGGGGHHGERSGGDRGDFQGGRGHMDKVHEKLSQIGGPTLDLPPLDMAEKKFNTRNKLYIGNCSPDTEESDFVEFFKPYGEINEIFINKEKNFAFLKFDFHSNAEKAKRELDGQQIKGRNVKIRFAGSGSSVKVKNLTNQVSNELLFYAFQVFGEVERALICVDDRGKPTGEGVIDFVRKGSALAAIRHCTESCYFLTASLRPCIVEPLEDVEDSDGFPDKNIMRRNPEFQKEREIGPRLAGPNSFEHEYGMRWKQLHDLFAQKEAALKKELEMEKEKLEAQMEFARYEHETELLREQLRAREMDRERTKREWEIKERQAEENRQRSEDNMRRQEEEMQARMMHQEEEMRRRQQENTLFMAAHQLDNMLDQQEQAYDRPNMGGYNNGPDSNMDTNAMMNQYDNNRSGGGGGGNDRGGGRGGRDSQGGKMGGGGNRGHWVNERGNNDYPMKRRRF